MSIATEKTMPREQVFNVPNQLTAARLILSIVLFGLIAVQWYLTATVVFAVAAGTDWLDGYWARKYGQVTRLGRVLDPFVDKIIICGTFIFLASVPNSGIVAWMAVLVVARELLVTALRSHLEGEGTDFSAKMSGKIKMALQCAAALVSLYALYYMQSHEGARPDALEWALQGTIYAAIVLTVYSGAVYVRRAMTMLIR